MANTNNETIQKRIDEQQLAFLKAYKNLSTITAICDHLGISRETYYDWMEKYPNFKKKIESANNERKDMVESQLVKAIKNNNITAIIFWLKSRHEDYKEKHEVSVGGELNINEGRVNEISELIKYAKKEIARKYIAVAKQLLPDKRTGTKRSRV